MSTSEKPEETEESPVKKELTASQLFDRYMRAVGRANSLAEKLRVEILESDRLSVELAERFGVHVGNKPPVYETQPAAREAPVQNEGESETEYEPPVQITAEAPRLSAKAAADVAKIRSDAGLSPEEQEDAEALATGAGEQMAKLQAGMSGTPTVIPPVVPSPGSVAGRTPDPGPDNKEGGPVTQGPAPEDK